MKSKAQTSRHRNSSGLTHQVTHQVTHQAAHGNGHVHPLFQSLLAGVSTPRPSAAAMESPA